MRGGSSLLIEQAEDLGYTAFGPVVLRFSSWLAAEAKQRGVRKLYFLSREGYFLKSLFEKCLSLGLGDSGGAEASYLLISRRTVFGALPKSTESLSSILHAGEFQGRLYDLLEARIGYSNAFCERIGLPNPEVRLLEDVETVLGILEAHLEPLNELARQERGPLTQYLRQEGLVDEGLVGIVDLGYSGSIQRSLHEITGHEMVGFYFATTKRVNGWQTDRNRVLGCFASDCDIVKFSPVFRYALALESWLTSPQGQLIVFEEEAGKPSPRFGPAGKMQDRFEVVEAVANGVRRYMEDMAYLSRFDANWYQFLGLAAEDVMAATLESQTFPEILKFLSVEDEFCGRGEISFAELVANLTKDIRLSDVV